MKCYSIPCSRLYLQISGGRIRIRKYGQRVAVTRSQADDWLKSILATLTRNKTRRRNAKPKKTASFSGRFKLFVRNYRRHRR